MRRAREILLTSVVIVLVLAGMSRLLEPRHDIRNVEFMPNMVYSKANESFSASTLLPGGVTQQPLVAGVVPRGVDPCSYGPGEEEATRAGEELENPLASIGPEDLDRGRRQYGIYCAVCHDRAGEGRGPVVARGMLPPPSLLADRAVALPDGALFHVLTHGQGNMAGYAAQLSAADRWRVVSWVRVLQGGDR